MHCKCAMHEQCISLPFRSLLGQSPLAPVDRSPVSLSHLEGKLRDAFRMSWSLGMAWQHAFPIQFDPSAYPSFSMPVCRYRILNAMHAGTHTQRNTHSQINHYTWYCTCICASMYCMYNSHAWHACMSGHTEGVSNQQCQSPMFELPVLKEDLCACIVVPSGKLTKTWTSATISRGK